MKQLADDQAYIREWLERINETDEMVIKETIEMMRTNAEYRIFVIDYAKGLIK